MRITPADVGRRVAVRRVLDDGRDGLGDVLGDLVSWTAGRLAIRTRDDRVVELDESAMVSGRLIPAPPQRRARS